MSDSQQQRPAFISKRTHVRRQKHSSAVRAEMPAAPRIFDRILIGLGYAGLGLYIYKNYHKLTSSEIVGLSMGSLTIGYGFLDLGKRSGIVEGAIFVLERNEALEDQEREDDEDWRGKFKGKEYEDLRTADKIAWLRKEQERIRDMQTDEQFQCGQAYIAKEEAYTAYEKHGGYGGDDWKAYNSADKTCQDMYNKYEKQQKRLGQIRVEIKELNEQL